MSPEILYELVKVSRKHFKSLIGVVFSSEKGYEINYDQSVNRIIVEINIYYTYTRFLNDDNIMNNVVDYFIYISDTTVKYHIEVKVELSA